MNTYFSDTAFPAERGDDFTWGMTLRDYFAAKVMQALVSDKSLLASEIARMAYNLADTMLEARDD